MKVVAMPVIKSATVIYVYSSLGDLYLNFTCVGHCHCVYWRVDKRHFICVKTVMECCMLIDVYKLAYMYIQK